MASGKRLFEARFWCREWYTSPLEPLSLLHSEKTVFPSAKWHLTMLHLKNKHIFWLYSILLCLEMDAQRLWRQL